ncbi:MAG TPA: SGNH/GDSL hydrolase family protein [Marmoricola sp.]|nr:SGNH/GDSL hydrolase family protein [Marmoricola sp.]
MTRALPAVVLALCSALLALGLAGCGGGVPPGRAVASPAPHPAVHEYVALGDSYTAAPFVPLTDIAGGCFRSDHDYPSLVARRLHAPRFRDVSCSGATTRDLARPQVTVPSRHVSVPPQLRALSARTDLVTLGIGGNDFGIFGMLVGSCPQTAGRCLPPSAVPTARRAITALGPRLVSTLRLVQHHAPRATVLLVGYPKIAPDHGTCPGLPVRTPAALRRLDRLNRLLDRTMAAAARAAGVGYVDVYRPSVDHDVCAPVPWVNGIHTDRSRAAALHPFGIEQRAVARLVLARLSR